jgi:hypothetical protein
MISKIELIDDTVYSYATIKQKEYIDAVRKYGSALAAAKSLKVAHQTIDTALKSAINKAAKAGYSPAHDMTKPAPDGFKLRGTSTFYDQDGKLSRQWVKTEIDKEKQEQMLIAAIESATSAIPRLKPIKLKGQTVSDLANFYTITDYHIGMLAWDKEGGADWDIKIAERILIGAFSAMIASSQNAEVGIINQMGDFLHFDGLLPVTPMNKHVLDADSRFPKLIDVAIRCLRVMVDMALTKHKKVHLICAEGNHDLASAHWLQRIFKTLYEAEPRVTVDASPKPYYCYQHGKTMLCVTHGHQKNTNDLPSVFASEFPKVWGDTEYRYCHEGHMHHKQVKEMRGMTREMHQTLAARDAYASRGGYASERSCVCITYSKIHGEVGRVSIKPAMLEGEA